jgi:hypothetical protein
MQQKLGSITIESIESKITKGDLLPEEILAENAISVICFSGIIRNPNTRGRIFNGL